MAETATSTEAEVLQAQARALGDPTRHAVFRQIADAPAPLGISELAERFPFHHNAIRQHVAKLVAAGLIREERAAAQGPGRPRHVYVVEPSVAGRWGTAGPYERLSRLLARMLRSGDDARTVGREAAAAEAALEARAAGHPLEAADVEAAIVALTEAMERQGFAPERTTGRTGPELILHRCPFETAAIEDRETICALHLGIAEGLVEALAEDDQLAVTELVAQDPRRARCRLRLAATPVAPPAPKTSPAPATSPAPTASPAPEPVLTLRGGRRPPRGRRAGSPPNATAEPGGSR